MRKGMLFSFDSWKNLSDNCVDAPKISKVSSFRSRSITNERVGAGAVLLEPQLTGDTAGPVANCAEAQHFWQGHNFSLDSARNVLL